MTSLLTFGLLTTLLAEPPADQATKASWGEGLAQWDDPAWRQPPAYRWLVNDQPIRSLLFENEPLAADGKPAEVFAYYATPGTLAGTADEPGSLPGVVLLHGGGGTAFAGWVRMWAKRGYAAIAIDQVGMRPPEPTVDADGNLVFTGQYRPDGRTRLKRGGPGAAAKFATIGGSPYDDWQQHAVAASIRAHSLLASFPAVDADRTAVTGISWGGYMTCLVASIDDRFAAAVPVYGCGFLADFGSVQRKQIDALPPGKRRLWIDHYDPSAWLSRCRVPILMVNGTNDKHYPLDSYVRSYDLIPGPKSIRIQPGMRHSHQHGWAPKEIERFIDHHCRGGDPLPMLREPVLAGRDVSVDVKSVHPIASAALHYTTGTGPLVDREWISTPVESLPAAATNGATSGALKASIPEAATIAILTVTDARDAMVSTKPLFTTEPATSD